jgi:hypothetical protein
MEYASQHESDGSYDALKGAARSLVKDNLQKFKAEECTMKGKKKRKVSLK